MDMQPNEVIGKPVVFRKYKKLEENEPIPLDDGDNSPGEKIYPDYKQQPNNQRKCIECGKTHDTIVENMQTGERLEELEKCKDCLFKDYFNKVLVNSK